MKEDLAIGAGCGLLAFAIINQAVGELTPLLIVGAALVVVGAGGLLGRIVDLVVPVKQPVPMSVTFADVGGQEAAKRELLEALEFVRQRDAIGRFGIRPLRGILLTGPPGTGKTLLAKAAATFMGSTFLSADGSSFVEVYAGVGAQRVRRLFERARKAALRAPGRSAVVFIDELEVVGGRRGRHGNHLEYDQTLNQLLVEMDGLTSAGDPAIVVIAATNRVDLLDEALLRPGRFDRVVRVDLPDRKGRGEILRLHLAGRPVEAAVDIDRLAEETFGFSGAHLEAVVNEAAILAWRQGHSVIAERHFREAIDKVMLGERSDRNRSLEERRRVAVHEAGHALVSELLRPESVAAATIVPRGQALGYVRRSLTEDMWLLTLEQLEVDAQIALGGYVAEQLIFGSPSTGAADDLRQVHDIVDRILRAGMSALGPVDLDRAPAEQVHEQRIDVLKRLQDAVTKILSDHRDQLDRLIAGLLEFETLNGEQIRAVLRGQQVFATTGEGCKR